MQRRLSPRSDGLSGRVVVITRPVGSGSSLARQVRAHGGVPFLLPGLALRAITDATVGAELQHALEDDVLIFNSPAAVRFAAAWLPLQTTSIVLGVGRATAGALRRYGVSMPKVPARQDSEGLLAHSDLIDPRGRHISLIGAAGGRGLLQSELLARGAHLREIFVYQRLPSRLDHRHADALNRLPDSAVVLLSSAESLQQLQRRLPASAFHQLVAATAVVSSERLAAVARTAGFTRVALADSALSADLLGAASQLK